MRGTGVEGDIVYSPYPVCTSLHSISSKDKWILTKFLHIHYWVWGKNIFKVTGVQTKLKNAIVRYKKIGYNINVMRQTACLVVNPIKVNSFAYLFNCTTVGRTSD